MVLLWKLKTQAVNDNQTITQSYVDQFRQNKERSTRNLRIDFYSESSDPGKNTHNNKFNDYKLTNIDSTTAIRNPSSNNEIANKKILLTTH